MYDHRLRRVQDEQIEVHDWLSVVHYAAQEGGEPLNSLPNAAPLLPRNVCPDVWTSLPIPMEWSIFKQQTTAVEQLSEGKTGGTIAYLGAIGLGTEIVVQETAGWLCVAEPWRGEAIPVNAHEIGEQKVTRLLPSCEAFVERVIEQQGYEPLMVLYGAEGIDVDNAREITAVAEFLKSTVRHNLWTITGFSMSPFSDGRSPFSANATCLYPLELDEMIKFGARASDDQRAATLREATFWVAGHFGGLLFGLSRLSASQLEPALNHLVLGTPCSDELAEVFRPTLDLTLKRGQARGLLGHRGLLGKKESLAEIVATIGSGISFFDLEWFDQPYYDQAHDSRAGRQTQKARVGGCLEYIAAGLGCVVRSQLWPVSWQNNAPMALFVNPLLRPYFRSRMKLDELERLDRWALGFAVFKLRALNKSASHADFSTEAYIYFAHARPFLIASLWVARWRRWNVSELVEELQRARDAGLWPERLEPGILGRGDGGH